MRNYQLDYAHDRIFNEWRFNFYLVSFDYEDITHEFCAMTGIYNFLMDL